MPNILKSKNSFLTIEYLENKTAEFVAKEYLATISEIISGCQFKGDGAMLFVNGFTLGIIWNNNSFYLFHSHSKVSSGNPFIDGTAALIHFYILTNILEKCTMNSNLFFFTSRFSLFKLLAPWKTFQTLSLTLKGKKISENTRKIVYVKKIQAKKSIIKIH